LAIPDDFADDFVEERLVNLCDSCCGIQTGPFGSQLHQHDYVPVGTPIITVEHLGENRIIHQNLPRVSDEDKERLSKYILRKGDIVFSRVGSVDRRSLVRDAENGWLFSGRCLRVRPDPNKIDPIYLSYLFGLPTFKEYIRSIAVGATMPSLNTEILSNVVVRYHKNLNEQRAIARILGTLDDKIELNRRMNETLEAMARALFKSWFVDFDPVRAKAEGREPAGMDAETAALFPDSFEETELGMVPKGWRAGTIEQEFNLTMGQSPPGETYNEAKDGDPFFQGRTDFGDRYPSVRMYCSAPTRMANKGDTLISVRAPVGDINMALVGCCIGRGLSAIRHKTGSRSFTYYMMHSLKETFTQFEAEGTVFGSINKKDFQEIKCIRPDERIIKNFEDKVFSLDQMVENNDAESKILASIRDNLLPGLLCGKVKIVLS